MKRLILSLILTTGLSASAVAASHPVTCESSGPVCGAHVAVTYDEAALESGASAVSVYLNPKTCWSRGNMFKGAISKNVDGSYLLTATSDEDSTTLPAELRELGTLVFGPSNSATITVKSSYPQGVFTLDCHPQL